MAQRDLKKDALQEVGRSDVVLRWMQQRIETIHQRVTVYDVLQKNGVRLRSMDREEQISCPFHGIDRMPSARVYPGDGKGPSHVWCFVCNERWDAISLWKKFDGRDDVKFSSILRDLENSFGITTPPPPEKTAEFESADKSEKIHVEALFTACENELRACRRRDAGRASRGMPIAFDMASFLRLGVVLDRLRFQFYKNRISPERTEEVITQIRSKITDRDKLCLED